METIIVHTDFSESASNALNYACQLAKDNNFRIVLTHIYTIPATYAGEGLSLVTINDALDYDRQQLRDELERARNNYAPISIEAKMMIGGFIESLRELKEEYNPEAMIMGAVGEYSELSLWDEDWLNALISITCPVLVIPKHIIYTPVKQIAFACDYKKVCLPEQSDVIKKLVKLSGAALHIVHVTSQPQIQAFNKNIETIKEIFADLKPQYHTIEDKQIIKGLAGFIKEYHIDLLLVIPHRHGLWHSLFNKSYTKQLAELNNIPVMAIHENN